MQNKPNFRMAQQRLTAGQEKGYVKRYELYVCENKANLSGRACSSVPARHRRGRPPCLPIPGGQPQGRVPKRDIYRVWGPGCPYEQARVQNKANFRRPWPMRGGSATESRPHPRRQKAWGRKLTFMPSNGNLWGFIESL